MTLNVFEKLKQYYIMDSMNTECINTAYPLVVVIMSVVL